MSDIKWQAPPTGGGPRSGDRWRAAAKELIARPGEWALISGDDGVATASNVPRAEAFRGKRYEFTSRKRDDGKFDLYARFMGDS